MDQQRRNRSPIEMTITHLNDQNLPHKFQANAINTLCYIRNRCLVRPLIGKMAYERYYGKIRSISHFKVFQFKCYILNTKDQLNKFDSKNSNDIFLRYSLTNSSYRTYNLETLCVEESSVVVFDEEKITIEIEINYDEEKEQVIVKAPTTPTSGEIPLK